MSTERNDAGQFAAAEEPKFGLAGVEQSMGYTEMPGLSPPDVEPEYSTAREAMDAMPPDPEPEEVEPATYRNLATLEPSDPRHTLTETRAGNDLVEYEGMVGDSRAKSIDSTFAEMVDRMRGDAVNGDAKKAEELGLEPPAEQKAKPTDFSDIKTTEDVIKLQTEDPSRFQAWQAAQQPDPYADVDGLSEEAKQALRVPQVREAIEKQFNEAETVKQAYSAELNSANQFGQASILAIAPELGQVPFERWAEGINIIAQSDPARGQQLAAVFNNVAQINERQRLIQHHQQQQQHAQFEAAYRDYSAKSDEVLGMTRAEKADMAEELIRLCRKAWRHPRPAFAGGEEQPSPGAPRIQRSRRRCAAVPANAENRPGSPDAGRPSRSETWLSRTASNRPIGRDRGSPALAHGQDGSATDPYRQTHHRPSGLRKTNVDEFLDRVSNFWRNRGLAYSPDALVQNLQLYGPAKRAAMLDEFDNALRDQGAGGSSRDRMAGPLRPQIFGDGLIACTRR